jgi:hypothetical protein
MADSGEWRQTDGPAIGDVASPRLSVDQQGTLTRRDEVAVDADKVEPVDGQALGDGAANPSSSSSDDGDAHPPAPL